MLQFNFKEMEKASKKASEENELGYGKLKLVEFPPSQ
jgi:hypothetical protein